MGYLIVGVLTVFIVYWFSFRTKEKERVVDVFVDHGPLDYFVTYDPARDGGDGSMSVSKPIVAKRHESGAYEYNRDTVSERFTMPTSNEFEEFYQDKRRRRKEEELEKDFENAFINKLMMDSAIGDWNDGSFPSNISPAKSDYDSGSSSDSSSSYDSSDSGSSDCGGGDSGD